MIQGGGFTREMSEKATQPPIINESNNGLLNSLGTLAMARTNDPNSATAQFFVNLIDNNFLNYTGPEANSIGYCVFGKVTEGMNVVRKLVSYQQVILKASLMCLLGLSLLLMQNILTNIL
ncbi:peptidyl-prolyl cis-trans isomerase B [Methylophilaceae bacterium]|nr:peptidyl-prolyl cis-trans isomerase B [Methylophilaceae bacterium]